MEILVLHPGALGDVILSLPALASLHRHFRNPRIAVAGNLDYLPFSAWGHAERTLSLSTVPIHRLFSVDPLPERDKTWWRSFDRVVSWSGADNIDFVRRLAAVHPSALVSRWKPQRQDIRHVSKIFLDSLRPWVGPSARVQAEVVTVSPEAEARGHDWLRDHGWDGRRRIVALHPGASAASKRWPVESFVAVARSLASDHGCGVLVIEGPAEPRLGSQVVLRVDSHNVWLAKSLPIDLLAAILSLCSAYSGNDSGVSHMAAALGLRSVVVFGPTLPEQWAPLGANVTVLRDSRGCLACRLADSKGHSCLENITPECVLENLL